MGDREGTPHDRGGKSSSSRGVRGARALRAFGLALVVERREEELEARRAVFELLGGGGKAGQRNAFDVACAARKHGSGFGAERPLIGDPEVVARPDRAAQTGVRIAVTVQQAD